MKKLIITCMLLTGASMASFAQNNAQVNPPAPSATGVDQMAHHRASMDVQMYGLTPDQSKTAYDIELEFMNAMNKFKVEGKQPSQGQMSNLQTRRDQKMKALMTPDQYKKFEAMKGKEANAPMMAAPQQAPAPQSGK